MVRSGNRHFRNSICGSVRQMVLDFEKKFEEENCAGAKYYGRSISENLADNSKITGAEGLSKTRTDKFKRMKSLDSVYFSPQALTVVPFQDDLLAPKNKNAKVCRIRETAVKRHSKLVDAQDLARYKAYKSLDNLSGCYQNNNTCLSSSNMIKDGSPSSGVNLCNGGYRLKTKSRHKTKRPNAERTKEVAANNEFDCTKGFDEEMSRIVERMQDIEREVEELSNRRNSSLSSDLEELKIYVSDSPSDSEDIFGHSHFLKGDDLTFVETYNNVGNEIVFTSVGEVRQRTLSSADNLDKIDDDDDDRCDCEIRNKGADTTVVRRETFYDIFHNPRIEKVSSVQQGRRAEGDRRQEDDRRSCHFNYKANFKTK